MGGAPSRHRLAWRLGLAAVLAVALALRLYGLTWDSGFSYTPHPDERAILMKVAELAPPALGDLGSLLDADDSPWNPRWFPYGSLPLYLLKGVQLAYSAVTGSDLTDLRVAGRVISTLADVGTVALVLALGSWVYGRWTGLLAAAFAALAVIHIQLAHFYTVDTLAALWAVLAVFLLYRVAARGRLADSALAGVAVGLGLATKVSLAPLLGTLAVAHLLHALAPGGTWRFQGDGLGARLRAAALGMAAAVVAGALVAFLAEPYAFLDRTRFWADFTEQSEMVRRIRDYPYTRQYIATVPYLYQARQLAAWGLGWPLGLVTWAGTLYAAVAGMRRRHALAYLALGWGVPAALVLWSSDVRVGLLASAVALLALIATLPFRSPASRAGVLALSWVVPYLLTTGAFEVKFQRYLLPVVPVMLVFGSGLLTAAREWAGRGRPRARAVATGALALVVAATAAYALSYTAIYRQPHTAVRASGWVNANAAPGSVVLKEHWEEGLPGLGRYVVRELPMYEPDTAQKVRRLAEELAGADYLVLFSNRMYGTLPRIPERYPASTAYYRLLFGGALGYRLADIETAYPGLPGISLVDDTFARPGVPEPTAPPGYEAPRLALRMGFADESFTVYDHPKVLVFENQGRRDAQAIAALIEAGTGAPQTVSTTPEPGLGLMLSPADAEAQRRGGTWSDIVREGSWAARVPVLAWLVVVEGLALLVFPLAFVVFRPLPDRGYLLAKPLGLVALTLPVWLLASLRWMQFSQASIMVALLALGAISAAVLAANRREVATFVRRRWRLLLIGEAVFLAAFLAFLALRMANPDLWHPYRGGEKPMDFAYLNAVLKSSYMPPYDPWFAGGYLNYYYWGQFIVATLVRATGLSPDVAYNLAVALMFALTAAGAFAVVHGLSEATRGKLRRGAGPGGQAAAESQGLAWSPVAAGLAGALFVVVLGNLDGAIQVGHGAWRVLARGLPFGQFDFWRSTRMFPPDPPGFEITEFPFFTFLFGDLHAHLIALPFTLLSLGLSLSVVLAADGASREGRGRTWEELARLVTLGVVVGSLRLINTWDFPTYTGIAVAAVFLAGYLRRGGVSLAMLAGSVARALVVVASGYLPFLPYYRTAEVFFNGLETTTNTTPLWQFLAVNGVFIFVVGSFLLMGIGKQLRRRPRGRGAVGRAMGAAAGRGAWRRRWLAAARLAAMTAVAGLAGYAGAAAVHGALGETTPFLAALLGLLAAVGLWRLMSWTADAPEVGFALLMVGVALALAVGVDLYRLEGDIDRMNTVFKVYLQVWVLLGLGSAFLLWRMLHGGPADPRRMGLRRLLWLGAAGLLVASAAVYPALGTRARLADRFNTEGEPLTLDGTAYAQGAVYHDAKGPIDLAADFEGIAWLRGHVVGSPVVLEGATPAYRWGGRVSVYTGLPGIVGWKWHQEQQRWGYREEVGRRIEDVDRMYTTADAAEALALMRKYGVEYVYVGQVERLYYPSEGLAKFETSMSPYLTREFATDAVAIYRVRRSGD